MTSKLNEQFTDKEKAALDGRPNCNGLLKRLMPGIYDKITTADYRLVKVIGNNRLIIHDRNYSGKGVKKYDLRLNASGVKILQEWQPEQRQAFLNISSK